MIRTHGDIVSFHDDKDWLQALLSVLFLTVFPPGIAFMWVLWFQPGDSVPLWFVAAFTAFFAVMVPFLLRSVREARTRILSIDVCTGGLTIVFRRPFQTKTVTHRPSAIESATFDTYDNDGAWHSASLTIAGDQVTFAQGSVHEDVYGRFQRMLEVLEPLCPDLPVQETKRPRRD